MRRVAALALALGLVLAGGVVAAPSSGADPIGACTATTGTIIAVDYGHWSGPIVRGCGVGDASGYDLLHDGGFTTAGDNHDGPAFICRLGNSAFHSGTQYPTPAQDACVVTPPASAYWSYWLAPAGQHTWSYSQLGAMSEVPKAGEVELWTFGGTNIAGTSGSGVPSYSPDSLRAGGSAPSQAPPTTSHHAPSATHSATHPATRPATHHSTAPGVRHSTHHAAQRSHRATQSAPHPASTGRAPSTSGSATHRPGDTAPPSTGAPPTLSGDGASGAPQISAGGSAPRVIDARPTAQRTSTGSALPLVLGLLVVVLLGGGAGFTVWRRRHQP